MSTGREHVHPSTLKTTTSCLYKTIGLVVQRSSQSKIEAPLEENTKAIKRIASLHYKIKTGQTRFQSIAVHKITKLLTWFSVRDETGLYVIYLVPNEEKRASLIQDERIWIGFFFAIKKRILTINGICSICTNNALQLIILGAQLNKTIKNETYTEP